MARIIYTLGENGALVETRVEDEEPKAPVKEPPVEEAPLPRSLFRRREEESSDEEE